VNLVVYACVTNGYDNLHHLLGSHIDPRISYVVFTDQITVLKHIDRFRDGKSRGESLYDFGAWKIREPLWQHEQPVRTARFHKVNAHMAVPEATHSIWLDGVLRIKPEADLWELAEQLPEEYDIAVFKHPARNCIYHELAACKRFKKDDPVVMQTQVTRYHNLGYPAEAGLAETSCVIRRHTPAMALLNAAWWTEIAAGSCRDQLSFNFVCWRAQRKYLAIAGCRDESPYFTFRGHKS
jgi:hypothetical protein